MIPIDQTRFGMGDFNSDPIVAPGNCFAASLASVLDCSLADVPDESILIPQWLEAGFQVETHVHAWGWFWHACQAWLNLEYGLMMLDVKPDHEITNVVPMYALSGGVGPRGFNHSVVVELGANRDASPIGNNFTIVHDPHKSREGFGKNKPFDFTLLVSTHRKD